MDADLARNLVLAWPAALVALAATHRALASGSGDLLSRVPAAFLAGLWVWLVVHAVEATTDWWTFAQAPVSLLDVPLEVSLGWALLWGVLPVLAGGPTWLWLAGLAWVDLVAMSHAGPLVRLTDGWLLGEGLLLAVGLAPALWLGRATVARRRLPARVLLQAVLFTGVFGWLVPTVVLTRQEMGWADVVDHSYAVSSLLLTAAVVVSTPALAAVAELARAGGTPYPWDPPDRLVTTGPYAYVANPMQLGFTGLMVVMTLASGSSALGTATIFAVTFSVVLAERHEQAMLSARWEDYADYRRHVRAWLPRWRPHVPVPATLWVSESCSLCSATGAVIGRGSPSGLSRRPAESSPVPLTRMRWESAQDHSDGVAAFARALEHTALPWAWLGWWMRLPGVQQWLQVAADACGLGPRMVGGDTSTGRATEGRARR